MRIGFALPVIACAALAAGIAACAGLPRGERSGARSGHRQAAQTRRVEPLPPATASAAGRQCLATLATAQALFTPLPDQQFAADCATVGTVRLIRLRSDQASLALTGLGPVACPLASAFAAWARFGVDRAARQWLGSAVARIETLGSYSCRNVAGSDRRSAHATAQAIDFSAVVLADGRRISVLREWNAGDEAERGFLRAIHASACKRFGTVLGPDYNAAHRDHLHLEFTGARFCR